MAKLEEAETHYQLAIRALSEAAASQKNGLDAGNDGRPWTQDLRMIDAVIAACRDAVRRDPQSVEARVYLLGAYKGKVEFLDNLIAAKKKSAAPARGRNRPLKEDWKENDHEHEKTEKNGRLSPSSGPRPFWPETWPPRTAMRKNSPGPKPWTGTAGCPFENVSGTIQVRSWDKAEVQIDAVKISESSSEERAKENADHGEDRGRQGRRHPADRDEISRKAGCSAATSMST